MTYRIIRFYFLHPMRRRIIAKGLTLEEAQRHCRDPETSSTTCKNQVGRRRTRLVGPWFDGYEGCNN